MIDSSKWVKKPVTKQQIEPLCKDFNLESKISGNAAQILASILVRRGITEGKDLLYFLEDDLRFQNEPFNFSSMEDAVERILQAKEEGEKVLIFGDSDVDGVTSTAILYDQLVRMGIDVSWRLPLEDDGYGLSIAAVDDFAAQNGTLIITVDCGISNNEEIAHANDLCIDVIVTDHHNPPENLPEAIIIIDPKLEDSGYPFDGISGAAVAYKLASALRFSESDFYNAEICILELTEDTENKCFLVDCVKIKNLIKVKELHEKIIPGQTSIYDLKLPYFLQGQLIYSWDSKATLTLLSQIFGSGIEFNINDLRSEISKLIPALSKKSADQLTALSQIAKYNPDKNTKIECIFNLYVTWCKKLNSQKHKEDLESEQKDLQLVALAALADIMPMQNENRIFVRNGISSIKKNRPRPGLAELFNKLNIKIDVITSTDLSWSVIPALNAAGRMGKSDRSLKLLISKDPKEREVLANEIYAMNEERKDLVSSAYFKIHEEAEKSIEEHNRKLCISVDNCINKGVTGILASKLMQDFNVPTIAITYSDTVCTGSMRSCRGFIATTFLDSLGDIFINHGGHNFAAGFSFYKENLDIFLTKIKEKSSEIELSEESDIINVDAEIPPQHLTPEVFKLLDIFEPYGAESPELVFMTRGIKLVDTMIVGKKEPQHLKLTFEAGDPQKGSFKIPGMLWSQADRLKKDISNGQKYDILYNMSRNHFNGITTKQIILKEIIPSD